MKAVKFQGIHQIIVEHNVEIPKPKGNEVLLKIAAAGVCHSDLHIIDGSVPIPTGFTLGHENAGWVEDIGEGVTTFKKGDAVLVYGPWGCGQCKPCQKSSENYCDHQAESALGGGLGLDGGMAEYMLVPSSRLLVPIYDLDPVIAAPLTDAALTPYASIKNSLNKLMSDEYVVVIGVGGLGHVAIQILTAICSSTIIACDINDEKLALAQKYGAQHTFNSNNPTTTANILKITGGKKAKVVLDFVGIQSTITLATQLIGLDGDLTVVGLGGGQFDWHAFALPFGVNVKNPYWGSRIELIEVVELARQKKIHIETETFPLDQAIEVYKKLENGQIKGRAILIP
ncbi:MAG: NAD(P)-dependent alcohol dehydrogenase [Acinetobacter sp.]